ncbi:MULTISPECIES: YciI family protein [Salipiger]|uniref:YciI family protein n=1 Tax=Salipiger TaxID=263377 RepID=UPI00351147FB
MGVIPEGHTLFVVDIEYVVPFEQIEPVLEPHMAFVKQGYADGHFLCSGPKNPRTGGIVIAIGETLAVIEALMAEDPFVSAGVVKVQITEFAASNRHPALV